MRFIVTGGLGFIGHNVVRQLKAQGHECIVLDSVTNYGFINKEEVAYLARERNKRISKGGVHHIDLREYKEVEDFFRAFSNGTAAVIHLASFPRQKVVTRHPVWGSDVMASSLVHLLELTRQYKIPKFVYISSSMVYGDFADGVTEDAVCNPQGQYAIMKKMGEDLVRDYTRRGCFNNVIIRPSAVYGEYDVDDRVISKFVLSALRGQTIKVNGATESLDFTHVDDTATGIVQATLSKSASNGTFNITRGVSHTLEEAASCIKEICESESPIEILGRDPNFPSRGSLSIQAARQAFDYSPTIDIEEGFKRYIDWIRTSTYWKKHL
jgi:nucleoside-diphosphate-sugar epimerase